MPGLTLNWEHITYRIVSRFQRWKTPERLPIRLHARRVYILPTAFGLFFGSFTLVMVTAGLNYNNNMALMLAFLIVALGLLVPIYTVRNLVNLEVTQISAQPVFAGQEASFVLTVINEHSQGRPVIWADNGVSMDVVDVPGSGRANLAARQPTEQRGWLSMRRTRLLTRYPTGLVYAWSWIEPAARCLVYPCPEKDAPGLPQGAHRGSGSPEHLGDEEWAGLREYQAGDPSRWIAWKAMARTDEMITKTFVQHESERIELDYAALSAMALEARLSRLCAWVLQASDQGRLYTLRLPEQAIGPATGESHKHRCLRALAEL